MAEIIDRKLIGKIEIKGIVKCLTGLHIGSSKENMEIGALDSPVVRDPISLEPYIPGSSLKGKLRSLLEKATGSIPNRQGGTDQNPVYRHECEDWDDKGKTPGALSCPVCRLFGSTGPGEGNRNYPARLKVRDLSLKNAKELKEIDTGLLYTEWKFENSIDRVTSAANPRNIERVPKGAEFNMSIMYDVEDMGTLDEDIKNLMLAIRILQDDSLGGHGSRGYGQVEFKFEQMDIIAKKIDHYRGKGDQSKSIKGLDNLNEIITFFK